MQRNRKHMSRKEVFCVLLCIMMIVGTAFSAAAQSAGGEESAEPAAVGFQESEKGLQNSEGIALVSEAGEIEQSSEETEKENAENTEASEGTEVWKNAERNGIPEDDGENSDQNKEEISMNGDGDGEKEDGEEISEDRDISLTETAKTGSGEGNESEGIENEENGTDEEESDSEEGNDNDEEEGDYSISWYDPTKSSHTISSAKQLAGLAYLVNKGVTTFSKCTLTLAADIDLSGIDWEPIGFSSSYSFAGTLDGAGHVIRNLSICSGDSYVGLFGYMRGNVKNLYMENAVVVSGKDAASASTAKTGVGAIAGYCTAGELSDLNVRASVTLKAATDSGETYVGGVIGYCTGNLYGIDFDGMVKAEDAPASAPIYIGGAAGFAEGKISDAVNRADVSLTGAESADSTYIGGLAGFVTGSDLLINCGNIGAVTASASGEVYTGGLAGKTDISDIENCFNQGSIALSPYSNTAYAGGLFGAIGDASLFNCYSSSKQISGSISYCGYLVGNVESTSSPVCDYVYWPGTGSYNSKAIYGMNSTPLKANLTCMGISYIASSKKTTLTVRLNEQSLASYDESKADNLYMWSLPEGSSDNDAPVFRTEALYPVYPAAPSLSIEKTEASLHARYTSQEISGINSILEGVSRTLESSGFESLADNVESSVNRAEGEGTGGDSGAGSGTEGDPAGGDSGADSGAEANLAGGAEEDILDGDSDAEYSCELKVDAFNGDSTVTQEYQWQILSSDGENYINVSGDDAQSSSYIVSAGEPGVSYYRLKITCQASYADAARVVYSDPIKVKTGWKILFADGGMADGSGSVTGASLPETIFPVLQEDGVLSLGKTESQGNYFLGWATSCEEGNVISSDKILREYDASEITGDVTLYAVFRKAGTMIATLAKGDENALLKEGVEPESLVLSADEGSDFILPDGNDYFTYEGYRFMGWRICETKEADENSGEGEEDDNPPDNADSDEDNADSDKDKDESEIDDETDQTLYQPGDVYLAGTTNITLTAVWSRLYQVTFDTGVIYNGSSETGGVQGELPETFQAVEGEEITLPSADGLSYEDHLFKNWKITYTDDEGTAKTSYASVGRKYTMPAADITVAAQWGKRLTVTFHDKFPNETDAIVTGTVPETIECLAGSSVTLPECTLERAGYVFTGWYEDGYDYTYQPGETMNVGWNINCYPVWNLEHEVIFQRGTVDGEGTITGEAPEPVLVADGYSITLPQNPFIPPDAGEGYYYRFVGWQPAQNSNIVYSPGASYTASSSLRQIVFRAVWKKTVIWKGEIAEEFGAGSGTADDPYQIATAGELAKIADDIKNKGITYEDTYFLLVDDIDLNQMLWTPIGIDSDRCFEGYFDGAGHTISSLMLNSTGDQYVGLFGFAEDAEITDLNMESVDIDVSYIGRVSGSGIYDVEFCTGAVVGRMDGGTLSGCSVSGSVCGYVDLKSSGDGVEIYGSHGYFAGMIGGVAGTVGSGTVVENCKNSAFIGGESTIVGGIVGYADDSSSHPALISGCYNEGTINNTCSFDNIAGGIAGRISFGDIFDCTNEGNVKATEYSAWLGGIAALSGGNIKECANYGTVSFKGDDNGLSSGKTNWFAEMRGTENIDFDGGLFYCAGAIVTGGIAAFHSGGTIEECKNAGNVLTDYKTTHLGSGNTTVPGIAGGIAGIAYGADVTDCVNSADVAVINRTLRIGSDSTHFFRRPSVAGGIAGDIMLESTISYCCTTGRVSANWENAPDENPVYKGTILGAVHDTYIYQADSTGTIISCYAKKNGAEEADVLDSYYKDKAVLENSSNKTEEQFLSGEVAYLLGYSGLIDDEDGISEEKGGRSDRGIWTQNDGAPALGSPSVVPVSVSSEKIDGTITLGNAQCSGLDVIYPTPGSTVYISANVADMSQNVTERTETETVEDGIWYYTYEDTEADTFKQILVLYEDAKDGEEESTVTGQSFVLEKCASAVVSALIDKDIASRLISSLFVPKEEEPVVPDEPKSSGGGKGDGKGGGKGNGNQKGEQNGPGGTDPGNTQSGPNGNPNANPNGNPVLSNPNSTVISDNPVLTALPSVQPQSQEVTQENAEAAAAPDSGGSGEPEDPIEEVEEPEEVQEDMTMFEVIQETIKSNPLMIVFLLIILIILLVIGGYSRYRKNNRGY